MTGREAEMKKRSTEAAAAAALAVAEAEVAIAEAEVAARVAEKAEAEAEAYQLFTEAALNALKCKKKAEAALIALECKTVCISSDETELLVEVASHGEAGGYEMPCLIVAAKDDLESFTSEIQDSTKVSQDMGIEAHIPIRTKLRDFNNIFRKIIHAAEHPHLSIPETEAGKSRKQYHRLINRSLMCVSVGAAVAVVGLAAYRVYAARKNSSG